VRVPRMTIRRWMIAAAFVAAFITPAQIAHRSWRFHTLASWHQTRVDAFVTAAAIPQPSIVPDTDALWQIEEAKRLWRYDFDGGEVQSKPLTAEDVRREEDLLRQSRAMLEASQATSQRLYDYHVQMSQKYRQAAIRPWLPLSPDPPIPE
jgi:hypothetical protein